MHAPAMVVRLLSLLELLQLWCTSVAALLHVQHSLVRLLSVLEDAGSK